MSRLTHILLLLAFICSDIHAQSLRGLSENPVIKKHLSENPSGLKRAHQQAKLLQTLPFFEDFSAPSVFPDPEKWTDNYTFVNNSFAVDPISVGVVTLDAIDEYGNVYAINNKPVSSDKITSHDFDLSAYALSGEVIHLSFFYQCGGKGETPELGDSLLLEYYYQPQNKWVLAWSANMDESSPFLQEILEVPDSCYTQGFRFRFRNITSISIDDVSGGEGALSNADCWNIDYIMMNTDPVASHQDINDIALTDIPRRMLDNYETIPWLHLRNAQSITRNNINFDIRNLQAPGNLVNTGRSYYVRDLNLGLVDYYEELREEMPTDTLIHRFDPFFAPFVRRDDSEEGLIEVVGYLVETPAGQYKQNDTSKILLKFANDYAYDDGTPEYGFGIEGPSMTGALLAVKFRIYQPDTLQAVKMLFNKALGNNNENYGFQLCIWKDDGGKPGELMYKSDDTYPLLSEGIPEFETYPVHPGEGIFISDTVIYIGWKQLSEEFLNIGYDVNRNNLNRTFLSVSGGWINPGGSLIPGTIMIRALFGRSDIITGTSDESPVLSPGNVVVYPNPVSGILNIVSESDDITGITVFDIAGRIVLQQTGNHQQLDVSGLSPGFYQLMINTGKIQPVNRKIIISR
jgi:hypothetical protein